MAFLMPSSYAVFSVNVQSPANNTNTTDGTPEIRFNITGDNASYDFVIWVDGVINSAILSADDANNTDNTTEIVHRNITALNNGTHIVVVEGRNETDNFFNSSNITIKVDDVAPIVTITSPANNTNTTDGTPEIFFTITDGVHLTNLSYRIFLDNVVQTANDTTNNSAISYNFTPLNNGTYRFSVEVTDTAGNVRNSTLITFTVDDVAPVITISSPTNNTNTTDGTPEIFFTIIDGVHTTNLSYRIFLDNVVQTSESVTNNTAVAYNFSAQNNGTHRFSVEVTDPTGNVINSTLLTIKIDTVAPIVILTSPSNGTNTTDSTPEIRFNITDGVHTTNLSYRIFLDGTFQAAATATNNTAIAYNFSHMVNGTHRFQIEATDPAGNVLNSTLYTIIVDNGAPNVTISSPSNNTNTTDGTPQIFFNVTDNIHNTNLTYRIFLDGTVQTANDTSNSTIIAYNFSSMNNGTHRFQVEVTDPAGNVFNSTLVTIKVDDVAPIVTITSPDNNTGGTDTIPEIFFNITDGVHTTNLTYRIYIDGFAETVNDTTNGSTTAFNVTVNRSGLYVGAHQIQIEVTDPAGNVRNSTMLTIQINAPATTTNTPNNNGGSSTSPNPKSIRSWNELPIGTTKIDVNDAKIGISAIELSLNEKASNARITIEKLSSKPASVSGDAGEKVYQYIEIKKENIKETGINKATIKFKVSKSWLTSNNYDKKDMVLVRYASEWTALPTKILSETSTDVELSAESPGFSTFAIAARTEATAEPPIQEPETPPAPPVVTTVTTTTLPPVVPSEPNYALLAMAGIFIVAMALYAFRHKIEGGKAAKKN